MTIVNYSGGNQLLSLYIIVIFIFPPAVLNMTGRLLFIRLRACISSTASTIWRARLHTQSLALVTPNYCVIPCAFEVQLLPNRFNKFIFFLYFYWFFWPSVICAQRNNGALHLHIKNSIIYSFNIANDLIRIARALKGALLCAKPISDLLLKRALVVSV